MERIDFHVHYNPEKPQSAYEVVDLAVENDVRAIGLLARNEVSAPFASVKEYGKEKGVEVYPSVELATKMGDKLVTLIGIGFDPNSLVIKDWLSPDSCKEKCIAGAKEQFRRLQDIGFTFNNLNGHTRDLEGVLNGTINERGRVFSEIIADSEENTERLERLKLEQYDVWCETVKRYGSQHAYKDSLNAKFVYGSLFGFGRPCNVTQFTETEEAIKKFHSAGGVALYSPEGEFSESIWQYLATSGVDGIMAWHGGELGMDKEKVDIEPRRVAELHRQGYLVLGGSDFQWRDWEVGTGSGEMYISQRRLTELQSVLGRKEMKVA